MSKIQANIPTYRAKKIDRDEYVKGSYVPNFSLMDGSEVAAIYLREGDIAEIDPSTLAIHFNKKDKEGNKVFFSLCPSGKGGDIVEYSSRKDRYIAIWNNLSDILHFMPLNDESGVKIIGIQKCN